MKRVCGLILCLAGAWLPAAEVKVGVIAPTVVLENSLRGRAAIARLNALSQEKRQRFDALQKEIGDLQREIMSPALTADRREKKSADLQAKQTEAKRFAEDAEAEMQSSRDRELETIKEEVAPILEKVAREGGYTLVMDAENPGVSYFEAAIDITAQVVDAYNQAFAKPEAPAAPR